MYEQLSASRSPTESPKYIVMSRPMNSLQVWNFWKFMNPNLESGAKNKVKPYFLTPLWHMTGESNGIVVIPRGTQHVKPYPTLGQVSGPKKKLDPQIFWPFAATDTMATASWNNNWKPKKMWKCKFCAISHLIWPTQSVKSWTFLGEIVVNLILLNQFHSESRLHIGVPKTQKSQRHCALGRVMSQKGKST